MGGGGAGGSAGGGGGAMRNQANRITETTTARITGGSKSGDFIQSRDGIWESETKSVSAAMLAGPNREARGALEPRYTIVQGEYKGATVYRLYQQRLGCQEFLKRFKTPNEAAKWLNK